MGFFSPNIEKLKAKRNIKKLIKLLKNREDPWIRSEAANALESLGWTIQDRSVLIYYLAAREEWEKIKEWDDIPLDPLIQILDFSNSDPKGNLKRIMIGIGKPIIPLLIKMLKNKLYFYRWNALEMLGEIGDPEAIPSIISYLHQYPNFTCKTEAITALGKIGEKSVIDSIVPYIRHLDATLRNTAAIALGKLGWKPPDQISRAFYLVAKRRWKEVGKLGVLAVEALSPVLEGQDKSEKIFAAKTLMSINGCDPGIRVRASEIYFYYKPQKKCMVCQTILDTERKISGIMYGEDILNMISGKGPMLERTAYKCRACGTKICYKCAQTSKCKICHGNVFDIAVE